MVNVNETRGEGEVGYLVLELLDMFGVGCRMSSSLFVFGCGCKFEFEIPRTRMRT